MLVSSAACITNLSECIAGWHMCILLVCKGREAVCNLNYILEIGSARGRIWLMQEAFINLHGM